MARPQLHRSARSSVRRPTAVLPDRDRRARALRVSAHPAGDPDGAQVVLSLWDGGVCTATFRLDPHAVPDLVSALSTAAVLAAAPPLVVAS